MNDKHHWTETLTASRVYADYRHAFSEATGLPLALRPVESWRLPQRGNRYENGFCSLMADQSRSCANCLHIQQKLSHHAAREPYTATCGAGLCETAVPVRLGGEVVSYLQTGQVFRQKPTSEQFERTVEMLTDWGVELDRKELEDAYFGTKVVPPRQYASTIGLLNIFSEHLGIVAESGAAQEHTAEPPMVIKAKQFIEDRFREDLSLEQVARAVQTSTFYFCKLFKRTTGENFTDFVSRLRIEKAKNLLLNPDLRVGEIAYEVGFQSLTHFNRVFKRAEGESPTQYRRRLPPAQA